jgi:nickel-dependent lactate racemase
MTQIKVPYGNGYQEAQLDDSIPVQIVDPECPEVTTPVTQLIAEALDNPIGTKRLEEMVTPEDHITIIVNDHTRPGPNAEIVDAIMKRLEKVGVPDDHVEFVVATGSHRASTPEELDKILGEEYHRRIRVHNHDCQNDEEHVYLGETESGMPLWVDKRVAEASFIITTGLIAPHHAAGFSGGRKSIVPGVAGIKTLHIHHSLPIRPFEPAMGYFEENPFHLAALEAAKKTNVRFIVNAVQDVHKQNIACVAGDLQKAHEAGVAICRKANTVEVKELADVVVASPGGAPRDCNLYQAQKALSVAEVFGKKGDCTFILCARAEDGVGEGVFRQWLEEAKTPEEVIERFRKEGFNVGNNKAFMYARALTKGRVIIVSENVTKEELEKMMLGWAPNLQAALDMVCAEKKPRQVIVLPKAVSLIPKVVC